MHSAKRAIPAELGCKPSGETVSKICMHKDSCEIRVDPPCVNLSSDHCWYTSGVMQSTRRALPAKLGCKPSGETVSKISI